MSSFLDRFAGKISRVTADGSLAGAAPPAAPAARVRSGDSRRRAAATPSATGVAPASAAAGRVLQARAPTTAKSHEHAGRAPRAKPTLRDLYDLSAPSAKPTLADEHAATGSPRFSPVMSHVSRDADLLPPSRIGGVAERVPMARYGEGVAFSGADRHARLPYHHEEDGAEVGMFACQDTPPKAHGSARARALVAHPPDHAGAEGSSRAAPRAQGSPKLRDMAFQHVRRVLRSTGALLHDPCLVGTQAGMDRGSVDVAAARNPAARVRGAVARVLHSG